MTLLSLYRIIEGLVESCDDYSVVIRVKDDQLSGDTTIAEPLVIVDGSSKTIYIGE